MDAHIILGINIDTPKWILKLSRQGAKHIFIFDNDFCSESHVKEYKDVTYINQNLADEYLKKFDNLIFYKSLYSYPGMSGKMSTLKNL